MKVRIVSLFAMMNPDAEQFTWEGIVDHPSLDNRDPDRQCEIIFRLFNRVNEEDSYWLADMGYDLPSLSLGDLIGIDKGDGTMLLYRVNPTGFEGVAAGIG